jgi:EpsI family protein
MNLWLRNFILMALMLAASGLAIALRPTHKIADQGPKVDLETIIPHAFADWREEKQSSAQIVDPRQKELIDKIYSQTLSRTYVNDKGYRIMLSIAYGSDQTDSMQVHKPEICYPAQGFVLVNKEAGSLRLGNGSIPVTRLVTTLGPRSEPVMYWTTIGDRAVIPGIQKKIIEMSYGLTGKIPDGMLIRVSSIDPDTKNAYEIQNQFSAQMVQALAPEYWLRLTGIPQQN